jgi:hypothetical protein
MGHSTLGSSHSEEQQGGYLERWYGVVLAALLMRLV